MLFFVFCVRSFILLPPSSLLYLYFRSCTFVLQFVFVTSVLMHEMWVFTMEQSASRFGGSKVSAQPFDVGTATDWLENG